MLMENYLIRYVKDKVLGKDFYVSYLTIKNGHITHVTPTKVRITFLHKGQLDTDLNSYKNKTKNSKEFLDYSYKSSLRYVPYVIKSKRKVEGKYVITEKLGAKPSWFNYAGKTRVMDNSKFDRLQEPMEFFNKKKEAENHLKEAYKNLVAENKNKPEITKLLKELKPNLLKLKEAL